MLKPEEGVDSGAALALSHQTFFLYSTLRRGEAGRIPSSPHSPRFLISTDPEGSVRELPHIPFQPPRGFARSLQPPAPTGAPSRHSGCADSRPQRSPPAGTGRRSRPAGPESRGRERGSRALPPPPRQAGRDPGRRRRAQGRTPHFLPTQKRRAA